MKWFFRLLGVVLGLGGLVALVVRPVPVGHVGTRDADRFEPGLHWAVEYALPLTVAAEIPIVHGLAGTAPAIAIDRDGATWEAGGLRAPGTPVAAVAQGDAAGFELFSLRRPPAERARSEAAHAARIHDRGRSARDAITRFQAAAQAEARAHDEARALGLRRAERRRAARRAEAEATIARIKAEAAVTVESISKAAEADAARIVADGTLVVERAKARRDALRAGALAKPGGRWYLAIEAARRFRFDRDRLDPAHPQYFQATWGLDAWRRYFLGARTP